MVLNKPVTFQFNQNLSSVQNSFAVIKKNVYSSSPGNHVTTATGLSYTTSSGKSGVGVQMGSYGFTYGLFNHNTDEVVAFSLDVGATLVTNETVTFPAGTIAHLPPGNYTSSQTFLGGPYTAFIISDDFFSQAAVLVNTPEINIKGNGINIANGDITPSTTDHTDFGSGNVVRTFTIENIGSGALTLSGSPKVVISGTNAGDFTLQTDATATIGPAGSSYFVVRFDPSVIGNRTATISVSSNDSNEATYSFSISGTGDVSSCETGTNDVRLTTHTTGRSLDNQKPDVAYDPVNNRFLVVYISKN